MMKMNTVLSHGKKLSSVMLRRFSSAASHSVELYQYEVCPFCAKAKATMDYYKVPYSTVEVNPLSKKELAFSEYKKVPLAVIDGKHVIESDAIMDLVRGWKTSDTPSADELKWRDWANQKLVVCLPPNLYRSLPESWDSFKYISRNNKFGLAQALYVRSVGSVFMRMMKGRMMKKHGIAEERQHLMSLLNIWAADALMGRKFQAGEDKPGVADLAVFGMMRSMEGVPTFDYCMKQDVVRNWYKNVEEAVGESSRTAIN
ncbi:hypothetical protein NDN08_004322 [Rhodosorus marinus]|uniref:GST N-terminal domain-containing protein n=1 Tax=Rhodosorus marinus TaxID=101924 RepID=A0AAV8UPI2_9RHOD|nr:hypothetical protein NDN08_004322 [Rhodosorus marinus]